MDIRNIIITIRDFIDKHSDSRVIYERRDNPIQFFKKSKIKVELDRCKEIILQDETKLELGGANKKSFSLIYPIDDLDGIQNGKITLIGPEISEISNPSIDFGFFMMIGFKKISEKEFDNLRHFSFVSNGIEGFIIRTIPRRFWCRVSKDVVDKFSFEIFGNAIMYLYKDKFQDLIESMEIVFISSLPEEIDEFIELTSEIRKLIELRWQDKIEEWKKRTDCDYDWECEECPYTDTCEEVKEVLEERKKM